MELILLIVGAGLVGYFLAGSKFSAGIDKATSKTADLAQDATSQIKDWWGGLFDRQKATEEVVDAEFIDADAAEEPNQEKKPAEKRSSRRKSSTE